MTSIQSDTKRSLFNVNVFQRHRRAHTHLLVLVGGHSDELCLLEGVRVEGVAESVRVAQQQRIVGLDHVNARLVLVHRVQNNLKAFAKLRIICTLVTDNKFVLLCFPETLLPVAHALHGQNYIHVSCTCAVHDCAQRQPATHVSVLVEVVVGELELVERDRLFNPV